MTGWNSYPGTPAPNETGKDASFFGPNGPPPSLIRQMARSFMAGMSREHLFVFMRAAHAAMETGMAWPRGVHLQALAWQLQQGRTKRGTKALVRMPATPLRALTALSGLPAWTAFDRDETMRTLCVARTKTLANRHRQLALRALLTPLFRWFLDENRTYQRMSKPDLKLSPVPAPATLMNRTVWAGVGDRALTRAFDQIVLVDPFDSEADASDLKKLLVWLKPLSGTKKAPASITIVSELPMTSPLIEVLKGQGYTDVDIPLQAFVPTTLGLMPSLSRTFKQGERLAPDHPALYDLTRARNDLGQVVFETLWT